MIRRLVVLLFLVLAAPAAALPGDPPVTSLSPADGATLKIAAAGVPIAVGCPTYLEAGTPGDPFSDPGFADSYRVRASTGTAVGADGVLADSAEESYPLLDGEQSTTSTCHTSFTSLQTPGTYHWQAYRFCGGCDTGKEVGPVRSFTLVPDASSVKITIGLPRTTYAGFGTLVPISVTGAERPVVTLQRRKGGTWVKLPSVNALNFTNDHIATFPAGRYAVRASVTLPRSGTVTSPEKTITVKRSKRGTPKADGAYADARYDLKATVARGGRQLRKFTVHVSGTCPIPDGNGGVNLNPTILSVVVPTVRIAPDGRFARAVPVSGNKVHLSGRLHKRRLTGTVVADTGPCSGTISAFSARRG